MKTCKCSEHETFTPYPPPAQRDTGLFTFSQHFLAGRTLAVAEAHVVLLLVVVSLFTLALTVAVRAARHLLHLVLAAHSAAQALGDVVPQLRE